jgi:hypothetical protein
LRIFFLGPGSGPYAVRARFARGTIGNATPTAAIRKDPFGCQFDDGVGN